MDDKSKAAQWEQKDMRGKLSKNTNKSIEIHYTEKIKPSVKDKHSRFNIRLCFII